MTRRTTFWLALFAAVLAVVAAGLRLWRGHGDDYLDIVGPAGIILLMVMIMSKNRPGRSDGGAGD